MEWKEQASRAAETNLGKTMTSTSPEVASAATVAHDAIDDCSTASEGAKQRRQ